MKFKIFFSMLAIALFTVSCSDSDDEDNTVKVNLSSEIAGSYSGYTSAEFAYSSTPIVTNGETLVITSNTDGTADLTFTSNQWGTTTASSLTVTTTTSGSYAFSGTSTTVLTGYSSSTSSEYEGTISGTLSADKSDMELSLSLTIMGGTTVTFKLGDAPAVEFLPDTYSGYTSAEFAYSSTPMVTEDETITITANDDESLTLVYESETWGTTTIEDITAEIDSDGNYILSGEGTSVMGMSGSSTSNYTCAMTGTVSSDKETAEFVFSLAIMGGTTITFNIGDAPTTE